jgi:hypothetical protein
MLAAVAKALGIGRAGVYRAPDLDCVAALNVSIQPDCSSFD